MAKWIEDRNNLINLTKFKIIRKTQEDSYYGGPIFYIITLSERVYDQCPLNMRFYSEEERDQEYERIKKLLLEE